VVLAIFIFFVKNNLEILYIMTIVSLPLNNNSQFSTNYSGYINVYGLDKTSYVTGFSQQLSTLKGTLINNNIINFTPFENSTNDQYWFKLTNGKYVPQKWVNCSLYQQKVSDLRQVFNFQGSFQTNTLTTSYGSNNNYTINAFIMAFDSNYSVLGNTSSPLNQTGNFSITLDTTNMINIKSLQWGFLMNGFPVNSSEKNQQGSVLISDYVEPVCSMS
jgi:hypothetical protein